MQPKIPFEQPHAPNQWQENIRLFKGVVHHVLNLPERIAWAEAPGMSGLMLSGCGLYTQANGHRWKRKGLDEGVFIYCVKGHGGYRRGKKEWMVNPGELLYCPPRTHQEYWSDAAAPWTIYWIHLFGPQLQPITAKIGFNNSCPILPIGVHADITDAFNELFDSLKNVNNETQRFFIQTCIYRILGLFAINAHRLAPENRMPDEVAGAISLMERSLSRHLSIDELANYAGLSAFHFCRLFKQHTGATPIQYFNRLKIHKACAMIAGSNLKIKEIATELGYGDPYYFSRLFKKQTGYSPENYRKSKLI
jgi:AraC-like DNA-binding protein